MRRQPCVYLLASGRNGTLYVGVTSNLVARVDAQRQDLVEGFTQRYQVHDLVWFEQHEAMESAIRREKAINKVAPGPEAGTDRGREPGLARPLPRIVVRLDTRVRGYDGFWLAYQQRSPITRPA